jgi:membrane glycosyltransferase
MTDLQGVSTLQTEAAQSVRVLTTPTGTQSMAGLRLRRWIVAGLNVASYAGAMWIAAIVFGAAGWSALGVLLFVAFGVGVPWLLVGFWNAVIGLWLLHGTRKPMQQVAPFAGSENSLAAITIDTAVLMTLRNEDAARAFLRLRTVKASLDATGFGDRFSYFILSDTNDPDIATAEETATAAWKADLEPQDAQRVTYRRRDMNTGYKAGNLHDFCNRWGSAFELMLPLDADSLMSGEMIVRLVRIMQTHPHLGILQSLVVGMPSKSAFARVFQFGMRHGMRVYTVGQSWWVGDCGPFWGHNALVRIKPFKEDCKLLVLPGKPPLGGYPLSHDQLEATLMRRAGYEVRVLPQEGGSWEETPPTMLDHSERDLRWCQGNMQYIKLLGMPGLKFMSRFQLMWAILMFIGIPALTLMIALVPVAAWQWRGIEDFPSGLAAGLYVAFLLMHLSPKLAGLLDVVLTPGGVARYGGPLRFAVSACIEIVHSFLQGAVSTIRTSIFMIGLAFGQSVSWSGQFRDAHGMSWATGLKSLWPQTLFGIVVCGAMIAVDPEIFLWSLPLSAGYLLAIPFSVLTASPWLGSVFKRWGLCGIPEDFDPPPEIQVIATKA